MQAVSGHISAKSLLKQVEHEKNNETALKLGDNFSKAVAEPAMLQHETNASDKKVAENEVQTDDVNAQINGSEAVNEPAELQNVAGARDIDTAAENGVGELQSNGDSAEILHKQTGKKLTRKRKKDISSWKANTRKRLRQSGQQYTDSRGKI